MTLNEKRVEIRKIYTEIFRQLGIKRPKVKRKNLYAYSEDYRKKQLERSKRNYQKRKQNKQSNKEETK